MSTERAYVSWIRRFILFHKKRHPNEMAEAEIRQFISYLAVDAKISASTQTVALSALLFLYREVLKSFRRRSTDLRTNTETFRAEGAMHEFADIGLGHVSFLSTVRFTDCALDFGVLPPINRWAIIIRPLHGLVKLLFVQDYSEQ